MEHFPHRIRMQTLVAVALAATTLFTACVTAEPSGGRSPIGVEEGGGLPIRSPLSPLTTTTVPRDCSPQSPQQVLTVGNNPKAATLLISQAVYPCADEVVVASTVPDDIAAASAHALAEGAGLLVVDSPPSADQLAEIARLAPETVRVFGIDSTTVEGSWDVIAQPQPAAGSTTSTTAPPTTTSSSIPHTATEPDHVWLLPAGSRLTMPLAPAAAAAGAELMEIDAPDLRGLDEETRSRIAAAETAQLLGTFDDDAVWQLDVVRSGLEIPGGGQLVFPGRRFVALYGNPAGPALGVLGEQGPRAAVQRAREVAAPYETGDGVVVVPTFEIIATVASANAGADNDYSAEMSVGELQPWIDIAAEEGLYVVLDLQPGRTDFLTQAKRYEELLRLPHVGLALDPEWRLEPDQVHLRQIGTVTAAEINSVSEWLAGVVRDAAIPQKLFIVHQFRLSMITERETIQAPPELAVVIQMDGQGPLSTKYDTYDVLTTGMEDAVWRWGWKNFYDEDSPTATPQQTLEVDPEPVFISYQ